MIYFTGSVRSIDLSLITNHMTRPDDRTEPLGREEYVGPAVERFAPSGGSRDPFQPEIGRTRGPKLEPKLESKLESKSEPLDPKHSAHILSECTDPNCIYTRTVSKLRQMYEQIVIGHCHGKKEVVLMFYASYKLLQELTIVERICHNVSEIHLVDMAYEDYGEFQQIFLCFVDQIHRLNPAIKIYFYPDLMFLRNDPSFAHKFDLIGGIDMDYVLRNIDYIKHRQQIKHVACYLLKTGGKLIISQHFNDLVDIAEYTLNQERSLVTDVINDYVKKEFYDDYVNKYSNATHAAVSLAIGAPTRNYNHHIHPIGCALI